MRKFLIVKNVYYFNKLVFELGDQIELTEFYQVNKEGMQFPIPITDIENDDRFQEIKNFKIETRVIEPEEAEEVKKYRVQLDVTTTRSKLAKIEEFLVTTIEKML